MTKKNKSKRNKEQDYFPSLYIMQDDYPVNKYDGLSMPTQNMSQIATRNTGNTSSPQLTGLQPNSYQAAAKYGTTPQLNKESLGSSFSENFKNMFSTEGLNVLGNAAASVGAGALGTLGGNLISGGKSSGVGNAIGDVGGAIGGAAMMVNPILGGTVMLGSKLIGGGINALFGSKMNYENINRIENELNQSRNYNSSATNFDELTQEIMSAPSIGYFSKSDIGSDGLFSNKASRKFRELSARKKFVEDWITRSQANAATNLQQNQLNDQLMGWFAYGGNLNKYNEGRGIHIAPSKFARNAAKWHAFGGDLLANGVEWDNGITVINNGGTHEESPYEGVQMGVDPQGIPNLVEEGEVIWNDYVFSNRIPVPNAVRSKYKLRGAKNMTFADAAKKASKESEEMPNDNIAQRGLQDIMSKLAYEQEAIREKRNMKRQNRQYAKGGILGNLFEGDGSKPQKLKTYKNFTPITNDFYTPEYMNFWNRMNDPKYATEANKWLKRINSGEFGKIGGNTFTLEDIQRLAHDYKKGPVHEAYLKASQEYNRFNPSWIQEGFEGEFQPRKFDLSIKSVDDAKIAGLYPQENKKTKNPIDKVEDTLPPLTSRWFDETVLRYAPVVGSAIGLGQTLFNKPDYSRADALAQYAQNAGKVTPISYDPLGNYLTYRPNDVEYIANKMAAQAAATRRGIMNTSGGNRAFALAGLAAQDYSSQLAQAEAIRQADESNFNRGIQVETFNRGTNQYNSETALKTAIANQEARMKASQLGLSGYSTAMQMKDAIDAQRNASINANLSSLFESLGNIGIDAANRRDRDFYINTVVPNLPIGEYARVYGKSKAKKEAKRRGYNDLEISNLFD